MPPSAHGYSWLSFCRRFLPVHVAPSSRGWVNNSMSLNRDRDIQCRLRVNYCLSHKHRLGMSLVPIMHVHNSTAELHAGLASTLPHPRCNTPTPPPDLPALASPTHV